MNVRIDTQAMEFVEAEIKAGRFASADEVVAEALHRMMAEAEFDLDDDTAEAIRRADEQFDRGEGIDFAQFAAEWRKRLGSK